jgi:hypothetical protein
LIQIKQLGWNKKKWGQRGKKEPVDRKLLMDGLFEEFMQTAVWHFGGLTVLSLAVANPTSFLPHITDHQL